MAVISRHCPELSASSKAASLPCNRPDRNIISKADLSTTEKVFNTIKAAGDKGAVRSHIFGRVTPKLTADELSAALLDLERANMVAQRLCIGEQKRRTIHYFAEE